jgi:hypothetical protein
MLRFSIQFVLRCINLAISLLFVASTAWADVSSVSLQTFGAFGAVGGSILSTQNIGFTATATSLAGNLSSISFYVQGNAPGYNDGIWHFIYNAPVSGTSGTVNCVYTPPANPGPNLYTWQVTAQAFDTQGNWNGNDLQTFTEYPQPQGVSLTAPNVVVGSPVTFNTRSVELTGNLNTLSFYVQGPGYPGWTNIGAAPASGADSSASFTWTPPSAGQWQALVQTWDGGGSVNYPNSSLCSSVVPFTVLPGGGGPTPLSLNATNANLGNSVTLTGRGTDSNSNTHLSAFSFYVQPGTTVNPNAWQLVYSGAASGNDCTMSYTWQPPTAGPWLADLQTWDATGAADTADKTTRFVVSNPPSNGYAFQILVDVNQLNAAEANSIANGNPVLAADGVWAIIENSSGISAQAWTGALAGIGSGNWAVSEDNPGGANEYNAVCGLIGRLVDGSDNYQELNGYANDSILTPLQIDAATANHGSSILVHARSYLGSSALVNNADCRGYFVNMALSDPNCSGVVFESGPDGSGLSGIALNNGINAVLNAHKRCYLLWPPHNPSISYLADVQNSINYVAQSGQLGNPNLYIVLAVYGRGTSGVSFLDPNNPTSTSNPNTLACVVNWLQQFRNPNGGGSVTLSNSNFSAPSVPSSYQYGPFTNGWTFGTSAGVQANGSAWSAPTAPNGGTQTAFLQGCAPGATISQSVNFPAGVYNISVMAAQRTTWGGAQAIAVYLDSTQIGYWTSIPGSFTQFTTSNFTATAGIHTIEFEGLNAGDNTAFIGAVSVNTQ